MQGKYLFAGIMIILGFVLLLDQYHVWTFGRIVSTWWPLILIGLGVSSILKKRSNPMPGIFLLIIGLIFQGQRLDILPGTIWGYFWPLMLIFIGVNILLSKRHDSKTKLFSNDKSSTSDNRIKINTLFSGIEQRIDSPNFAGGEVSCMFAGVELDLRPAKISDNNAFLEMNVAFGEIVLRVPNDIIIDITGSPFLGGFENKTNQIITANSRTLVIKYSAMFGSIEITN
jgi:predicted membrane protein